MQETTNRKIREELIEIKMFYFYFASTSLKIPTYTLFLSYIEPMYFNNSNLSIIKINKEKNARRWNKK